MLKKMILTCVMISALGMGAAQLVASGGSTSNIAPCTSSQEGCCPATNQGAPLSGCIVINNSVTCTYTNGSKITNACG